MSLINDALKRASQADKLVTVPRPAGPALQPVVRGQRSSGSNSWLLGAAIGVTALLGTWFLWQWFATTPTSGRPGVTLATKPPRGGEKTTATNDQTATASTTLADRAGGSAKSALVALTGSAKSAAATLTAAVARQAETPTPLGPGAKPLDKSETSRTGEPARAASASASEIPSAVLAAAANAAPASPALLDPVLPAPLAFPPIRLQGVIYRPTKATAFINGRMMSVGDQLEEAMLVKIDHQSVTFELGKESKVVQLAK